ncbi:MAG: hypothetical protein JWQ38_2538 [Flavipsychrobacter sp.]|nr:hypothetical protein [Flavipsychrobacter sp.]
MEKKNVSYRRMIAVAGVMGVFACSVAWIRPSAGVGEKEKESAVTSRPVINTDATTPITEEGKLVQLLEHDGLISEVKGFVVEKSQNNLFIDGVQLPADVAGKYISSLKNAEIRVQVFPFAERLKMHPDAGFIQLLLPVSLSSPCVDNKPKKPGC